MKENLSLQASIAFVMLYISLITMFASLMLVQYVLLTISGLVVVICIYLLSALKTVGTRKSILIHIANNVYLVLLLALGFLAYFGLNFVPVTESHTAEYVHLASIYGLWIFGYYAQWRALQTNGRVWMYTIITIGMQAIWIFLAPDIISILELFLE